MRRERPFGSMWFMVMTHGYGNSLRQRLCFPRNSLLPLNQDPSKWLQKRTSLNMDDMHVAPDAYPNSTRPHWEARVTTGKVV